MEEYSFVDIFATKGLEYLVVLVYFVLIVVFTKSLSSTNKGQGDHEAGKD
ncbi:hypothetical protein H8E07_15320 [bacterium]|nr:hypothetical protein [bacterium]